MTAPDSPWEADGLQRDSEAVRLGVHQLLIATLEERAIPYLLLEGSLQQRMLQAARLLEVELGR